MDFIVNLPMTPLGFDGIFTIVDRFSSLVIFLQLKLVKCFLNNSYVNMAYLLRYSVTVTLDFNLHFGKVYVSALIHV